MYQLFTSHNTRKPIGWTMNNTSGGDSVTNQKGTDAANICSPTGINLSTSCNESNNEPQLILAADTKRTYPPNEQVPRGIPKPGWESPRSSICTNDDRNSRSRSRRDSEQSIGTCIMPSALLGGALGPSAAASWYTEGFSLPMDAAKVAAKLASRRGSLGTAVTMEPDFEVLGLVPHGWEDIINPPDTWLERFSVGYLGNLAWTAIGALPVMFAIASWKSFSLGPTSKSERGPDIAQFADVLLTLGSLLAYIGFSFSCCFPGEKNTVPRVLLTGVWAVGAVTHLILAFTSAAPYGLVSAITILCCLFAAALVLGVFGQQAFETPFTVFFVVPYCCLFAIYVVVTSVVIPAIEREAEYVVLGVRIGLILVSGIPPIVTHMSLHHVHKILPRQVRYAFGGVETIVLLPSKILTFLLPPGYAVAAEAVTILVRGSFFCLLPSLTEWYFARRGTNPDSPMWQQIRLHMSQATFVTAQSNFCCILASGQIIICNRYRYGESLRVRQVLLYAMCQFAALGIETIITTAVLHGRGIPISGVYWLFEKREHYSCALLTVAVTVVSISPQFLYSISILDMMY